MLLVEVVKQLILCVCLCVRLHSCSCEVKFVQECGVERLWEVVRCDFLLPRN